MQFKVTDDKRFLQLIDSTQLEYEQLHASFVRKLDNFFVIKKRMKNSHWNGEVAFIDKYGRIPIGLYGELQKFSKKFNFKVDIIGIEHLIDLSFKEDEFKTWVEDYFKESDIKPRDYQIEAASKAIKYKFCTEELSTSSGKTLIAFMIFRYLLDKQKITKMLYVVPNVSLVDQTCEKFYEYEESCKKKIVWKSECVYGGAKSKDEKINITFGTYQSLNKKEVEFFKEYNGVVIDECLHPDTLITMSDYSKKKIKDINIGDKVWTKNEITNKLEIKEVDYVYKNLSSNEKVYELELEDDSTLIVTGNHRILLSNNNYRRVDHLNINDILYNNRVKSIKEIEYFGDVYNLRIKSNSITNHNYFANDICVANCHHSQNSSIKTILVKNYNAIYKIGLTGTMPKEDSCNSFTIQAYLGPTIYKLHSAMLINEGNATPVNIIGIELDYLSDDVKKNLYDLRNVSADEKDGVKLLNLEKNLARTNRKRFLYICETISKTSKNSLVIFSDVQNEYGRKVYNWIKENTEKTVFYVDGSTPTENREYYKNEMEKNDNIIIVASVGCFGEGISINNIHNIFSIESFKSEIIVAQLLGRGMRLLEGKEKINVFDFYDNYEYGTNMYQRKNYLLRHANERALIYKKRKFPYKTFKIKL